jgi:uncharacterized protein (DUF305 family)
MRGCHRAGTSAPPSGIRAPYNTMDAEFVRLMIPHHSQSLQMAELAPVRAGDVRIRALAP